MVREIIMANPIEITQPLYGEDAEHFLKMMEEPLSEKEIALAKKIREMFRDFDPFVENPDDTYINQMTKE